MVETVTKTPKDQQSKIREAQRKHVVLYKNKIIADDNNSAEALQKAHQKHPNLKPEQIELHYIHIAEDLIF